MIRTFYSDSAQIREVLEKNADDDRLIRAGGVLHDLGLSICNHQEEFNQLCEIVPEHLWLGGWRCEGWFLVLHNRVEDLLPETRRQG
jgi:hypothetical protein